METRNIKGGAAAPGISRAGPHPAEAKRAAVGAPPHPLRTLYTTYIPPYIPCIPPIYPLYFTYTSLHTPNIPPIDPSPFCPWSTCVQPT